MDSIIAYIHRGIHDMTVVAQAVAKILYGRDPEYRYFQGASHGGRNGLVEAQCYPEEYDGIWPDASATNHCRMQPAYVRPYYVMNWHGTYYCDAKLNAFRDASGLTAATLFRLAKRST